MVKFWTFLAVWLPAAPGWACTYCAGRADSPGRVMWLAVTALMLVLPIGMTAGLVLYLRRAARKQREASGG